MNSKRGRGRARGRSIASQHNQDPVRIPGQVSDIRQNPVYIPGKVSNIHQDPDYVHKFGLLNLQEHSSIGKGKRPTISPAQTSPSSEVERDTSTSSLESIDSSSGAIQKFAARPGYGANGRPIDLISNYFQLKLSGAVFHYDIEINSLDQIKKYGKNAKSRHLTAAEAAQAGISRLQHELNRGVGKMKRKEVFDKLMKIHNYSHFNPVFDGVKNVFTSKPLPIKEKVVLTVDIETNKRMKKYEVIIQPAKKDNGSNEIQLDKLRETNEGEREIIMALNSIMNHRDMGSMQIQVGRSFFYLTQNQKIDIGEGLEIWFGYHQSIQSTESGAVVVINLAAKAFHKEGPVIDYINDVLRRDIRQGQPMKPYEIKNVTDALKGIKVEVTHLSYPRRYFVEGISKLAAHDMKLSNDSNGLTIAKYFETKYRRLQFPFLHCLHMRSSNQQTYIPLEHCKIMGGQPKLGKLSPALGAKMIKKTAITPNDRFNAVTKSSRDVSRESGEKMSKYNLFMDFNLKPVRGRVLDPPSVLYNECGPTRPDQRGVWNMTGKFRSLIEVNSWVLLDFADSRSQLIERLQSHLISAGRKVGLNFGKPLEIKRCGRNITAEKALREAEKTKATLAIIILSRRDRYHSYDEIKFIADYQLQFVNQCIDSAVLERFNDQIATNLCLKINVKLGGINHILNQRNKIFKKPVMIIGADAVHAPRGSRCPSIAAVVGSMDAYPSKYSISCRVQENPDGNKISQELILEMREMVTNLLKKFYHQTKGHRPEKIIFFRDGVSEGQFQSVYEYEITKIQEACREEMGSIIPITFVIVQKRHQTRLKPRNPKEGIGRSGNIPPGTTVDTTIVHPHRFDYFLNSHEGIQGTNKPAHYTVLHDDNEFSADDLQELSYHLCYTYNKCNRSISIPAPVKYADLACYRAKKYADYHLMNVQEYSSSSSGSSTSKLPDHAKEAINNMGEHCKHFFFV